MQYSAASTRINRIACTVNACRGGMFLFNLFAQGSSWEELVFKTSLPGWFGGVQWYGFRFDFPGGLVHGIADTSFYSITNNQAIRRR